MHYFSNLFDKVLYMFRTGPLSHHEEYLNTVYRQYVFVMLILLASASVVKMELTTLADANRISVTNTYCLYTVLRYS
jgi:hypothetical protein